MNLTELTALQLLEIMEHHHIYLHGTTHYGYYGWEAYTPDPGGHYMEDRIRILGSGKIPVEAMQKAIEKL